MRVKGDVVCDPKRRRQMRAAVVTGFPGTWVPGVHADCIHNEIAALLMRSLAPLPAPPDAPLADPVLGILERISKLSRRYGGVKWSHLETALSYDGNLRRRYLDAERSLRVDGPLCSSDVYLRPFLKAEKIGYGKSSKPRMIFPRSPRYNLVLASWLKPYEHWLWGNLRANRLFGGSSTRVVAKGLNPRQRANLIARKFGAFRKCVVFEVDGKAWEAHVSQGQIRAEHEVYLSAYGHDDKLRRVLSGQLEMKGKTKHGVKFHRVGGRASGDFNTGMGNTLLMLAVVVSVLERYGVVFDVLVDGDNALVFLEEGDSDRVVSGFASVCALVSGHELILTNPVREMEAVRFGQSAPIFLGRGLGWTMVREPLKVLSQMGSSHIHLVHEKWGRRWLHGVARCELSLARGVPVLQAAALSLLNTTDFSKPVAADRYRDYFMVGAWLAGEKDVLPVSIEARLSYESAFGVSPQMQVCWEKELKGLSDRWFGKALDYPDKDSWVHAQPGIFDAFWEPRV